MAAVAEMEFKIGNARHPDLLALTAHAYAFRACNIANSVRGFAKAIMHRRRGQAMPFRAHALVGVQGNCSATGASELGSAVPRAMDFRDLALYGNHV